MRLCAAPRVEIRHGKLTPATSARCKSYKKCVDYKGKDKTKKYKEALEEYNAAEMKYRTALVDYNQKLAIAMAQFLLDEQNLREVFAQFLDGDVEAIDYTAESDASCEALLDLGVEVLSDFFDKGRSLMSVFKK